MCGIQKGRTENGLRDSQSADNQREEKIDDEKFAQLALGIDQRVSQKNQRNVAEIDFNSQDSVNNSVRSGIEDLHHSKPNEKQHGYQEGRAKTLYCLSPVSREEGNVNERNQDILGEINGHVVSEEFAGKILEQQPGKKEIQSIAPAIEYSNQEGGAQAAQGDIGQTRNVVAHDVLREQVDAENEQNENYEQSHRVAAKIRSQYVVRRSFQSLFGPSRAPLTTRPTKHEVEGEHFILAAGQVSNHRA